METYHRKVERRQLPSLQITTQKLDNDLTMLGNRLNQSFNNVSMAGQ